MKNPEIERGLLAAILSRPSVLDDHIEKIHLELFTDKFNQDIFRLIEKMYQDAGKISRTQLLLHFREKGLDDHLELISESSYLLPEEVGDLIEELTNFYNQRVLRSGLSRAYEYVEDHNFSVDERNAKVQDIIFELTNQFKGKKLIYNAEEVAISCLEMLCERQEGKSEERLRTGIKSFDSYMAGGLRRKNLTVLAGGTSMGKTAFALNLARNIMEASDIPIFFLSLEMAKEELLDRLLIQRSKVAADAYNSINEDKKKPLPDKMIDLIETARNWIHNKNLLITDRRGLRIKEIKTLCRKADNLFDNRLGFIIIDYLSEINIDFNSNKNTAKIFGDVARELRELSKELNCHILLLHQISRDHQKRNDKRPIKSDLRDSGELEEKADNVIFVHRPAYFQYQHEVDDEPLIQKDAEIIIAKQRGGKTGLIKFVWYPEIQYWQEGLDYYNYGEINYLGGIS